MKKTLIVLVIASAVVLVAWVNWTGSQTVIAPRPSSVPPISPPIEKPAPIQAHVIPPPEAVPLALRAVMLKDAPLNVQVAELHQLTKKPKHDESAEALRWLIRQTDRPEVLRNEVLNLLGTWDAEWLVADLSEMMIAPAQSPIWREYCVQHIGHHYKKHRDSESLKVVDAASKSDDYSIKDQALFSLAVLAKEFDWRSNEAKRFDQFDDLLRKVLSEPESKQLPQSTVVSALRAAAQAELKDLAPAAEQLAMDEKRKIEVRVAAVQALGIIGRTESLRVLEFCNKSTNSVLAKTSVLVYQRLSASNAHLPSREP